MCVLITKSFVPLFDHDFVQAGCCLLCNWMGFLRLLCVLLQLEIYLLPSCFLCWPGSSYWREYSCVPMWEILGFDIVATVLDATQTLFSTICLFVWCLYMVRVLVVCGTLPPSLILSIHLPTETVVLWYEADVGGLPENGKSSPGTDVLFLKKIKQMYSPFYYADSTKTCRNWLLFTKFLN